MIINRLLINLIKFLHHITNEFCIAMNVLFVGYVVHVRYRILIICCSNGLDQTIQTIS